MSLTSANNQPHPLLILLCDARSADPPPTIFHHPNRLLILGQPSLPSTLFPAITLPEFLLWPFSGPCPILPLDLCPPIYFSYIVSVFEAEEWAGLIMGLPILTDM